MTKYAAILLALACCGTSAWAQDGSTPANALTALPVVPVPPDRVNNCNSFYPSNAQATGLVTLSVHITAQGLVGNAAVVSSSGRDDLDKASISCLNQMFIQPPYDDGKFIDIDWRLQVRWLGLGKSIIVTATPDGKPNVCNNGYPRAARRIGAQGAALVLFRITTEGTVRNAVVSESTGNADLDEASIECASSMRYAVATRDGKPVEFGWRVRLGWFFGH